MLVLRKLKKWHISEVCMLSKDRAIFFGDSLANKLNSQLGCGYKLEMHFVREALEGK